MQMNIHISQLEGEFCDKQANTIKPLIVGIINFTMIKWIWKTGWPTAIPPAVAHGLGKETVLPLVGAGDSKHLSFFPLWKENFT